VDHHGRCAAGREDDALIRRPAIRTRIARWYTSRSNRHEPVELRADRVDVPVQGGAWPRSGSAARGPMPRSRCDPRHHSSSRSWLATARALGDRAALVAVDLRGRGRSNELPPPFGIAAHVRDMTAVLDRFELDRAVVVGHSLGAYIAARLAIEHPERIRSLVLVDGGLTIPGSSDVDPERFLETFLGPTLARLKMTFADRASYRACGQSIPPSPAVTSSSPTCTSTPTTTSWGTPPELHSSVVPQVVRDDGVGLFGLAGAQALAVPAVLLCAPRGMVDDPNPMQPLALAEAWAAADRDAAVRFRCPTSTTTRSRSAAGAPRPSPPRF